MSTLRDTIAHLYPGSTVRASFTGIGSVEGTIAADIFGRLLVIAEDGYDTAYRLTGLGDNPRPTLTGITVLQEVTP